jgi:hypothetical protein
LPLEVLSPLQRESLITFLADAFHLPKTAPFVQASALHWKYDELHPDWTGSRSYAWMDQGQIGAHACLCPVSYRVGDELIKASYLIDWGAGRHSPGAGVLLLRKLASFFQVLLAIGGSTDTISILPKLGYRIAGEISFFARVIRPWRQFRTDPFPRGWKAPLRLARSTLWSLAPRPVIPPGWSCTPIGAFEAHHAPLLDAPLPFPSTRRTPELMNYLLRCPAAQISAFLLSRNGGPCGWFLLSKTYGVLRIADLRVASAVPEDWRAGYALATQTALADPDACELVAAASIPLVADAIRSNGFRFHHADPVFLLDPKGVLATHAPIDVALIESDAGYNYVPQYPYLT